MSRVSEELIFRVSEPELTLNLIFWGNGKEKRIRTR